MENDCIKKTGFRFKSITSGFRDRRQLGSLDFALDWQKITQ